MPACKPDELKLELDVDAGEYLKYTVTFAPGAVGVYGVRNTTTKRNILKPPQRVAEWPERGESVDRRTHTHVFGATFLPATRYSYKVVVCRRSGSTKQLVKRCKWTHPGRKPRSSFKVKVL